jgi:UDP-glucose 4-epimerase
MKIFLTGATGFIGSHVCVHLSRCGHEVVAASRDPEKLPALFKLPGAVAVPFELSQRGDWGNALAGIDAVVHVALGWGDTGPDMLAADTAATVALLDAAHTSGVKRFVYTSSTAACGPMDPSTDESRVLAPNDLYGATKAASEVFARAMAMTSGMKIQVIRPGYIFGEPALEGGRSQPDRRFAVICRAVMDGAAVPLIRHDGTQFLAAQDIAMVYEKALGYDADFSVHYALSREWRSWEEVARMAMSVVGREVPIDAQDLGWGEVPHRFDVSALERDFGLSFGNQETLMRHVAWQMGTLENA